MARDVLSIPSTSFKYRWQFYSSRDTPVTSVDTERAFKAGKNTISDNRHSLADKTIRASILFGDWSKQEGLLSEDILLRYTKDKVLRNSDRLTKPIVIDAIKGGYLDTLLNPLLDIEETEEQPSSGDEAGPATVDDADDDGPAGAEEDGDASGRGSEGDGDDDDGDDGDD